MNRAHVFAAKLTAATLMLSIMTAAQPKSALEFYDSTGANATARFGWEGSEASGRFFLQAPVGTDAVSVRNGDMSLAGEVSAARFNGDGSGLSDIGSDQIANGSIVDADVADAAAISGTKVQPDFGNADVTTSGAVVIKQKQDLFLRLSPQGVSRK
jgi:hypothetical protein